MPTVPRPKWVLARRRAIGHHVANLRAAQGLSVDDVARAAGLERRAVMRVENGKVSTGLDILIQLAKGMGVPLGELLQAPEQPN